MDNKGPEYQFDGQPVAGFLCIYGGIRQQLWSFIDKPVGGKDNEVQNIYDAVFVEVACRVGQAISADNY